jgi:hypothetical protein
MRQPSLITYRGCLPSLAKAKIERRTTNSYCEFVRTWRSTLEVGFDITEVVAEYGILRSCIERLAEKNNLSLIQHAGRVVNSVFDKAWLKQLKRTLLT